jgi:hypothetical protein
VLPRSPPGQAAAFVLAVFAASASWQFILVSGGAQISRVIIGRRGGLATSTASSVVIAWLAFRPFSR